MIHAPSTLARLSIAREGEGWRFARQMGPDPARVFIGRAPKEAARLAPLVYNLCGAAHAVAAASALGLSADLDRAALARRMAQETARDHARAILLDWPAAMGEAPDRDVLSLVARPDGAGALALGFTGTGDDLSAFTLAELSAWLDEGATGTARLLSRIRREVDPMDGRVDLPDLTAADLAAALSGRSPSPEGAHDGAGQDGDGALVSRETGALPRMAATPLLSALLAEEGPSLFVRLMARLLDGLAALREDVEVPSAPQAPGIGLAEAARGLLGHGARVEEGKVAAYCVLSPSAWNLSPGGLLERAFGTLAPGADLERRALLLVSAINPCLPVTVSLKEAAHA